MTSDGVMHLLAPMTPRYLRRAGLERTREPEAEALGREAQDANEPWLLRAVVTVDTKGRVPWSVGRVEQSDCVASIEAVGRGLIVLTMTNSTRGDSVSDGRGRLQLRRGLLDASGIGPGDRLAIVQLGDSQQFALTSVANLVVLRRTA